MPAGEGEFDARQTTMTHEGVVGIAGAGAWGTALANAAAAAGREVVIWGRGEERMRAFGVTRLNDRLPGVRLAPAARATAELGDLELLHSHPGRNPRPGDPGRGAQARPLAGGGPPRELRQGHRARDARLHDRHSAAGGAGPPGRDPFRAILRRRRGGGAADGGDARQRGQLAGAIFMPASARAKSQALSLERCPRRRGGRRGEERARDRLRRRRRPGPWRERGRCADRPRLRRAAPVRRRRRGATRDAHGPVRTGRSRADLLVNAVAQLLVRHGARPRRDDPRGVRRPARRGRLDRARPDRDGPGVRASTCRSPIASRLCSRAHSTSRGRSARCSADRRGARTETGALDFPRCSRMGRSSGATRMLFVATCIDRPGSMDKRMENRPAHLAYLNSLGAQVKVGGVAAGGGLPNSDRLDDYLRGRKRGRYPCPSRGGLCIPSPDCSKART